MKNPRTRVIPVLLLDRNGLYKTEQFGEPKYVGDPVNTVRIFNDKEADELILLDFCASREKRDIDYKTIGEVAAEAFMPMGYGGGIKSLEEAKKIFGLGFEKVVLNSSLFSSLKLIDDIASIYGAQAVVGAVDVKKDFWGRKKVYSHSGSRGTGKDPIGWVKELESAGIGEIVVNSINRDGTWQGYDLELLKQLSAAVSVPVIALGGAGTVDDLKAAVENGASAVAAGSMFVYQKKGKGVLVNMAVTHL